MGADFRDGRRHDARMILSAVLPVFNEARVLEELSQRVSDAIFASGCQPELIFVNDGSTDDSPRLLDDLASRFPFIRVLHLSRNFGHQAAVQAGLEDASGAAVIVMDSDLQDDPSGISAFLAKWREGYDVVYAIRFNRKEAAWKRLLFFAFYRVLNRVSGTPMPEDAGNFGLLDARVAREVLSLRDRDRYFAGLRSWVGFRQVGVPVERGPRYDGQPRVSMNGLLRLAKSAIFSFSSMPLSFFYALAGIAMTVFVGVGGFALYHKLFTGLAVPGWASTTMLASFSGAINALGIAVLGEYVIRIYDQVRERPMFVVARKVNFPRDLEAEDQLLQPEATRRAA